MTDPLTGLFTDDRPEQPAASFAADLRGRIEAIENRTTGDPLSDQIFIPYLAVTDSRAALTFYSEVFGAELEGEFFEMEDGRVGHATMTINGQFLFMADEFPEMNILAPPTRGGTTLSIVINVADADQTYEAALAAGAVGERPPANAHGNRSGWFSDPWGHRWSPTGPEK